MTVLNNIQKGEKGATGETGAKGDPGTPGEVSKAELNTAVEPKASKVESAAAQAAAEASAAAALLAQPTLAARVNLVTAGGGPTKTAAQNAAAFVTALGLMPTTGGKVELGPGWWLSEESVVGGTLANIEIAGTGNSGSGTSGSISGKKIGSTNLVLPTAAQSLIVLGEASGATFFFGNILRDLTFVDGSGGLGAAGVLIRKSGYNKIYDCSFFNFISGAGIGLETPNTEYDRIVNCNFLLCKYGIKITAPDTVIADCMVKGCKNTEEAPIVGSVGITLGSLSRITGTVVQGHDTDVLITGNSNIVSVRTETVATFTTKAHRAMVVEGNNNIIDLVSVNNASYSEKALKVAGNNNIIRTTLTESQIENLGTGNQITHG